MNWGDAHNYVHMLSPLYSKSKLAQIEELSVDSEVANEAEISHVIIDTPVDQAASDVHADKYELDFPMLHIPSSHRKSRLCHVIDLATNLSLGTSPIATEPNLFSELLDLQNEISYVICALFLLMTRR